MRTFMVTATKSFRSMSFTKTSPRMQPLRPYVGELAPSSWPDRNKVTRELLLVNVPVGMRRRVIRGECSSLCSPYKGSDEYDGTDPSNSKE